MESIAYNLLIGASGSLVASIVFLLCLFYGFRPKIRISPHIAKHINDKGVPAYVVKIVNDTRYPLVDLRIELVLLRPRTISNGSIDDLDILVRHDRFQLDSQSDAAEPFGNEACYTFPRLEDHWKEPGQHLVFRVIARHSLSQFSRVFLQKYEVRESALRDGQFANGSTFEVVPKG